MGIKSFLSTLFYPDATEERSAGFPASVSLNDPKFSELFNLNAGPVTVSEETALSLATFYRCVDVLSNSFAQLPGELLKTDIVPDGVYRMPAIGHPIRNLLFDPNSDVDQTPFTWKKTMFANAIVWGNAYARIIRNGVYRPIGLKIYHPREVLVTTDLYRNKVYYRFVDMADPVGSSDVIHFKLFSTDGIMGRSIIRTAPDVFKTGLQSRRFANKLFENGARPAGIIKHKGKLSDGAKAGIKASWFENYGGVNNVGKTAVLEEDMQYQAVGINPVDAQLLEVMRLSDEQVCTLTGVPQHMAGILTRSTNNNIEHQGIEYVVHSLTPHVVNFEQELDRKLLRVQERGLYYHNFDLTELLRGDLAAQQTYFQGLRNAAIISANEVRNRINYNPYKGGNKKFIQGAMMPLDEETGLPIYPPKVAAPANGSPVNGHKLTDN